MKITIVPAIAHVLIEGDSTTVSCMAEDSSSYPNVTFQRKDDYGDLSGPIKSDQRIKIVNSMHNDTEKGIYSLLLFYLFGIVCSLIHLINHLFHNASNSFIHSFFFRHS